jgi:hypothetical protein
MVGCDVRPGAMRMCNVGCGVQKWLCGCEHRAPRQQQAGRASHGNAPDACFHQEEALPGPTSPAAAPPTRAAMPMKRPSHLVKGKMRRTAEAAAAAAVRRTGTAVGVRRTAEAAGQRWQRRSPDWGEPAAGRRPALSSAERWVLGGHACYSAVLALASMVQAGLRSVRAGPAQLPARSPRAGIGSAGPRFIAALLTSMVWVDTRT